MNPQKIVALFALILAVVFLVLYIAHTISWDMDIALTLSDLTLYETAKVLVT